MDVRLALLALAASSPQAESESCPWCAEAGEQRERSATVTHEPASIMRWTPAQLAASLPAAQWVFLETPHLRFASSLGPVKLDEQDRKAIAADLDRWRSLFPDFPKRPKRLDPWLRLHLLALRAEDFYARFQSLLQVDDGDFAAQRPEDAPFMGVGAYLGEKDKFEIVVHASRATHEILTREVMGVEVTDALRWHFSPEHQVVASIPAEDADLRQESWLYPHATHVLSHMFLCAFRHFSYDPPIWLDEGLAHAMEREVNPLSTTLDGDEGGGPHRGGHEDWSDQDVALARRGRGPTFADMLRWQAFHDIDRDGHVAAWSRVGFLIDEHPDALARFVAGVKGQLDERGVPTGRNLVDLQRTLLREVWGWTPADFDEAWRAWRLEVGK